MPPPQPCNPPLGRFEPVNFAQVANTPISNSLGLKNSGGGGGGGAITCLGSGGPANATSVCEAMPITAKAIIFFITIGSSMVDRWYMMMSTPALDQGQRSTPCTGCRKLINPHRTLLLDFGPIRIGLMSVGSHFIGSSGRRPVQFCG